MKTLDLNIAALLHNPVQTALFRRELLIEDGLFSPLGEETYNGLVVNVMNESVRDSYDEPIGLWDASVSAIEGHVLCVVGSDGPNGGTGQFEVKFDADGSVISSIYLGKLSDMTPVVNKRIDALRGATFFAYLEPKSEVLAEKLAQYGFTCFK